MQPSGTSTPMGYKTPDTQDPMELSDSVRQESEGQNIQVWDQDSSRDRQGYSGRGGYDRGRGDSGYRDDRGYRGDRGGRGGRMGRERERMDTRPYRRGICHEFAGLLSKI